eukprot:Gb_36861 [translate_table: standard]
MNLFWLEFINFVSLAYCTVSQENALGAFVI